MCLIVCHLHSIVCAGSWKKLKQQWWMMVQVRTVSRRLRTLTQMFRVVLVIQRRHCRTKLVSSALFRAHCIYQLCVSLTTLMSRSFLPPVIICLHRTCISSSTLLLLVYCILIASINLILCARDSNTNVLLLVFYTEQNYILSFLPYAPVEHRPHISCIHPALSCAARSIFLQLYL